MSLWYRWSDGDIYHNVQAKNNSNLPSLVLITGPSPKMLGAWNCLFQVTVPLFVSSCCIYYQRTSNNTWNAFLMFISLRQLHLPWGYHAIRAGRNSSVCKSWVAELEIFTGCTQEQKGKGLQGRIFIQVWWNIQMWEIWKFSFSRKYRKPLTGGIGQQKSHLQLLLLLLQPVLLCWPLWMSWGFITFKERNVHSIYL